MKNDFRYVDNKLGKLDFRADENNPMFRGHAAVFYQEDNPDSEYWLWWDVVERLAPGCFDRPIDEGDDTRHLFNHDSNKLLGRRSAETLKLSVDSVGLFFESPYDENDSDHRDYRAKIQRGDLAGCSFSFSRSGTESTWQEVTHPIVPDETLWIRTITQVGFMYDVGGVTFPAYEATDIEANSKVELSGRACRAWSSSPETLVEARQVLDDHRSQAERDINKRFLEKMEYDFSFRKRST